MISMQLALANTIRDSLEGAVNGDNDMIDVTIEKISPVYVTEGAHVAAFYVDIDGITYTITIDAS